MDLLEDAKENSLRSAGYALLVGDAGLFASGIMSGRYKEATAGLAWGIGGLACAKYGNPNADAQLKLMSHKLGDYLRKQHIIIPHSPDDALLAKPGGVIDRIEDFLYTYPSQMMNTVFAVGGVQLLRSGLQHRKGWDAASGALVTAGALAGLLIPETNSADSSKQKSSNPVVHWFQEKPLRISAAAYTLNDITLFISAMKERRANPAQKSYLFKFLTVGAYAFGNAMLAMSSKQQGGDKNNASKREAMEKLADTSAHVVAAQHPELQDALVQQIAVFLSSQPEVTLKAPEISAMLREKLADLQPQTPQIAAQVVSWQQNAHHNQGVFASSV